MPWQAAECHWSDTEERHSISFVPGDMNAKMSKDAYEEWQGICAPYCNDDTKMALDFFFTRTSWTLVKGCHTVSSRPITIHLRAVPFNITIVKVYTPMSDYGDNETEDFCDQLQNVTDQTPKKDILLCKETGMHKWAKMLVETGMARHLWTLQHWWHK